MSGKFRSTVLGAGLLLATVTCRTAAPASSRSASPSARTAAKSGPMPLTYGAFRAAPAGAAASGPAVASIETRHTLRNAVSRPLREIARPPAPVEGPMREVDDLEPGPGAGAERGPLRPDPVVQTRAAANMPPTLVNFEGVNNVNGVQPADTSMAVGPDHVFQWVNLAFEVFDKSGNSLAGPFDGNTLFTDLGGDCAAINGGDIIVMYDQFADRWFLAQLAPAIFGATGNHECMAVSTSGDPLGSYFLYDYLYGDALNDYPKFGIWPDAYTMTAREFGGEGGFTMTVTAFDRAAMLAGAPVTALFVSLHNGGFDGLLPADLDGPNLPPGTASGPGGFTNVPPQILMGVDPPNVVGPDAVIHQYQLHCDFQTPANTTFTGPVDLPIAPYNPVGFFQPVDQPPPGAGIESLGWILYRLPYRNFGTHESIGLYHDAVAEDGRIVPRWYQVRDPYGVPVVYQQGTFAPDDGLNRWMGSIAMDGNDNIAIGYSAVDDTSVYPSIRYAGRLADDPPNELTQGEAELIAGSGAFVGVRWGDYSIMDIDPVDDCTFWYSQMYIGVAGLSNWQTRVGSFKFPSCFAPGYGTVEGTVTDANGPVAGARVGVTGGTGGGGGTTDAAGHYSFNVPAGTYSLTARKYGYSPATQPNVVVDAAQTTTQDFTLVTAPSVTVGGNVRDDSGGNWPLYAKVVITTPGAPVFTVFTDPVSGNYSIPLVTGNTFHFKVTAVSAGYAGGGGDLALAPVGGGGITADWPLSVDQAACNAPGYERVGLSESFDGGALPPGWETVGTAGLWSVVSSDPCGFFVNNTGGTGPFAVANSNCDGEVLDDTELRTPPVDMSGLAAATVAFDSSFQNPSIDLGDVDVSTDGGASWTNVLRLDTSETEPVRHELDITGLAAGQNDVRARFHFYDAFQSGWWQVDGVFLGDATCAARDGGLVVGSVLDANTQAGLNGAAVDRVGGGASAVGFATPLDPAQPDGMYILFDGPGAQSYTASIERYSPETASTSVVAHGAVRLDFHLPAGQLSASPRPFSARVSPGQSVTANLFLNNTGGAAAAFRLLELDVAAEPAPPFGDGRVADAHAVARALGRVPEGRRDASSASGLALAGRAPAAVLSGGSVVHAYPTGLAAAWGIAYDTDRGDFWLSNAGATGGDDREYRYETDGTQTGDTIDDSSWVEEFAADGAFNARTGMLWRVNVGGDNCLYELDPFFRVPTGNKICVLPWAGISQRGLAYDVLTDTYYVGGWNDGVIYHIDGAGNILESTYVGLPISGLAYDTRTGHLFAATNHGPPPLATFDVYVLDAAHGMAVVGAFNVLQNGAPLPGLLANGGGGLEIACDGRLWMVDRTSQLILEVDSGEHDACAFNDVPWLTEAASSGSVAAGVVQPIACTFDSASLSAGLRLAQLKVLADTPYTLAAVPVDFTVRFNDVQDGSLFDPSIYGAAGAGVMPGCDPAAFLFCPTSQVTRADMAGFILRAVHGPDFVPAPYAGAFADVQAGDYNADYIQSFFDEGYTVGCGGGNFCPNAVHTRAQTAVFILKGTHGTSYAPPACGTTHVFDDVPCPPTPQAPFGDWIGELFLEGITAGCGGNSFCPSTGIPNQQMAAFLVRAFHLPHL